MELPSCIVNNRITLHVKPNSRKTEILSVGPGEKIVHLAVAAPPEDNKANVEIVRFLSKELKQKVRIKSGLTSKRKVVEIVER